MGISTATLATNHYYMDLCLAFVHAINAHEILTAKTTTTNPTRREQRKILGVIIATDKFGKFMMKRNSIPSSVLTIFTQISPLLRRRERKKNQQLSKGGGGFVH